MEGDMGGLALASGRELLRGTFLSSGISDEDANAILGSARTAHYPVGPMIFAKGAPR